jgi:esterase/lipase
MHKLLRIMAVVALLVSIHELLWVVDPARYHLRFQATGFNSHFKIRPDATFLDYTELMKENISLARSKAAVVNSELVVAENSPRILLPDPQSCPKTSDNKYVNGVLLIHGLLDSPYTMNVLGEFLQKQCFIVYIILLPGHGTVPGDLLDVTYRDWIAATRFGVNKISEQAKNIFIMGYSLGGLLAVNEVLHDPKRFKAAILFAPALELKTRYALLIAPVYWLSRIIQPLQWLAFHDDSVPVRYESYTTNSAYQTLKLLQKVRGKLQHRKLALPIFVQQSADDMTIDAAATLKLFLNNTNAKSKLLWYAENNDVESYHDARIKIINGALPAQRILDMSHLSYSMPPDDKIYGIHGEYRDCLIYSERSVLWEHCKTGDDNYFGEVTAGNLARYLVQRMTFNPFYEGMLRELGGFVGAV